MVILDQFGVKQSRCSAKGPSRPGKAAGSMAELAKDVKNGCQVMLEEMVKTNEPKVTYLPKANSSQPCRPHDRHSAGKASQHSP